MRKKVKAKDDLERSEGEVDPCTTESTDTQGQDNNGRDGHAAGQPTRGAAFPRRRLGDALKDIGDRIKSLTPTAPSS